MNDKVWHKGPPPHIGWWNAMRADSQDAPLDTRYWRWWDGENWSFGAFTDSSASAAYVSATASLKKNGGIFWTDYYPEGARVPRVDPSDPKNLTTVSFINMTTSSTSSVLWEDAAWKAHNTRQMLEDSATLASKPMTRTVREMKERMTPPPVPPGYVSGSRQRLSEAVRIADADFSGAMGRNQDPDISRLRRRDDPSGAYTHLRGRVSNGQRGGADGHVGAQNPERREIGDPFHGITTMALLKEVVRRLNV